MKRTSYSTYEAKARFSELVRKVRAGETVYISYRGTEVAEMRPLKEKRTPEETLTELENRGLVSEPGPPPPAGATKLEPLEIRPGALARFLESRD